MPALYRMPVAYLIVLVAAAVWAASTIGRRPVTIAGDSGVTDSDVRRGPIASPPISISPSGLLTDGILRTPEGLRRKVLIRTLGATVRGTGARDQPIPLDYLSIHFVFGERPGSREIGPAQGPPIGWVDEDSTLEWDTRLMARPTARQGRPPLVVYRDRSCLLDALTHRVCPRHGSRCPTEGEDSGNAAEGDGPKPALGLPILSTSSTPQPDGSSRTIFEVASPVRDRAPLAVPSEPPADLQPLLKTIYLAVVLDTTASMGATIEEARAFAADLVNSARDRYRDVTLKLALVEYRDQAPEFGFAVRIAAPFGDPSRFLDALGRLKAATSGDGTVEERVLDGMGAALPPLLGGTPGLPHLGWPTGRAGELATKMVVLIGDAPDHDRDAARASRIASGARTAGVTIASVRIERPGALSRVEESVYRAQWHAMAAGSYLPRDRAAGFARPVPPLEATLGGGDSLVPRLRAMLDDRVDRARDLAALAAAEAEGRLVEYTNRQGIAVDAILPVLNDLHRGEPAPTARPDPRFQGKKAPSLRKGWIAERAEGKKLVDLEILMSRSELEGLIDELRTVEQATIGTSGEMDDLLSIGRAAISGEAAFLASDRGDRTFADHLRSRQGLPPSRPDSLLHRTQGDLLQADDTSRGALDARLRATLVKLIARRNAPDWDEPGRTVDGMAAVPYEWLDW